MLKESLTIPILVLLLLPQRKNTINRNRILTSAYSLNYDESSVKLPDPIFLDELQKINLSPNEYEIFEPTTPPEHNLYAGNVPNGAIFPQEKPEFEDSIYFQPETTKPKNSYEKMKYTLLFYYKPFIKLQPGQVLLKWVQNDTTHIKQCKHFYVPWYGLVSSDFSDKQMIRQGVVVDFMTLTNQEYNVKKVVLRRENAANDPIAIFFEAVKHQIRHCNKKSNGDPSLGDQGIFFVKLFRENL